MHKFCDSDKLCNYITTFSSIACSFEVCSNKAYDCIKSFEDYVGGKTCGCIACCNINSK